MKNQVSHIINHKSNSFEEYLIQLTLFLFTKASVAQNYQSVNGVPYWPPVFSEKLPCFLFLPRKITRENTWWILVYVYILCSTVVEIVIVKPSTAQLWNVESELCPHKS